MKSVRQNLARARKFQSAHHGTVLRAVTRVEGIEHFIHSCPRECARLRSPLAPDRVVDEFAQWAAKNLRPAHQTVRPAKRFGDCTREPGRETGSGRVLHHGGIQCGLRRFYYPGDRPSTMGKPTPIDWNATPAIVILDEKASLERSPDRGAADSVT